MENYFGNHAYSTEKFVESTAADFYALDKTVDHSTKVFVLTGTVVVGGNQYYSNISFKSGTTSITIYCANAGQYSWLTAIEGEVTVEIAPCNWNDKGFWAGCVLAIRLSDGTKIFNTYNFDKF